MSSGGPCAGLKWVFVETQLAVSLCSEMRGGDIEGFLCFCGLVTR